VGIEENKKIEILSLILIKERHVVVRKDKVAQSKHQWPFIA
jgi:hypothetical protein